MATVQDVMNKTDEVLATVRAEREEVQAKLADLSEQLQNLTDSIAVGGVASPDQLNDIVNRMQSITDEIKNISEPFPVNIPEEPAENANDPVLQQPIEDRAPKGEEPAVNEQINEAPIV